MRCGSRCSARRLLPGRTSAIVAAVSLALEGCVTVPPAGYPPQSLVVTTHHLPGPSLGWGTAPPGAHEELRGVQCTATNDRGSWTFVTPSVVAIERSAARLRITCRREGYREALAEVPCAMPGTQAVNALRAGPFLGPLVLVVIPATLIGGLAAAGRDGAEPGVCAYNGGSPVEIVMER